MTWLPLAGPLLLAIVLVVAPGLLISMAAGYRGFAAAALAPVLSVTAMAVGGIAGGAAGVPWGWWTPLATALVLAGAAWAVRRALGRWVMPTEPDASLRAQWPWWAAAALGTLLWLRHLRNVFDRPDAFSQTFDNIYHLSLIRFMAENRTGSSLAVGALEGPGVQSFYPAAFHDLASLVLLAFPGSIAVATTATVWAVVALAWPLGCVYLASRLLQTTPATAIGVGVLSASFTGFPLLLLEFGVLYPNLTALALLPAVIGLTIDALGLGHTERFGVRALLAGALALPGVFLSHPSAVLSLFAVALPMLVVRTFREAAAVYRAEVAPLAGAIRMALMIACLPVFFYAWTVGRPDDLPWPPRMVLTDAVGQAVLNAPLGAWPAWAVSLLVVLGIVACWRRRQGWLAASWGITVVLWTFAASGPEGDLRDLLTGGYYNDPFRLAALFTVAAFPLATLGLDAFARWTVAAVGERTSSPGASVETAVGVLVVLALLGSTQRVASMDVAVDGASATYALTADAPLLSTDEYALLMRVPGHVEPGAVVATNPWNGSSLLYAFTGVPTTTKHISFAPGANLDLLNLHLDDAATLPEVCPAAHALGVRYALDFGLREVHGAYHPFPGLENLATNPGLTEVDREGEAVLYRVDACG